MYGLGEVGRLEGLVFPDWKIAPEWPRKFKRSRYGMDFGYTNDPTTLVEVGIHENGLYVQEYFYEPGLTNPDIADMLQTVGIQSNDLILADSSEPKSIEEIRKLGFNIVACEKGAGSVMHGIDSMKRYKIFVHPASKNVISEFSQYTWKKDRNGKPLNVPIDKFNHAIDASRYASQDIIISGEKFSDWGSLHKSIDRIM